MTNSKHTEQGNGLFCALPQAIDPDKIRKVHVSLEFERIGEIDTHKEMYFAEILLKLTWKISDSIADTTYDSNKHWNPKVSIENMFVKPDIKVEHVIKNDEVTEIQKIKAFFWERLEIANFPLDIQELSIVLITELLEVNLVENHFIVKHKAPYTFVEQQRWKLYHFVDVTRKASYDVAAKYQESNKSKLVFKCYCRRKSKYYFLNAFFLIFIITLTAFNIFSVDCKAQQNRISMAMSLLLTSISFKWVYNRALPTVNYLTSLDKYSIIHILFICLLCVWNSIIGTYWEDKVQAKQMDQYALISFAIFFALIQIVFIVQFLVLLIRIQKYEKKEQNYLSNFTKNADMDCFYFSNNSCQMDFKRE